MPLSSISILAKKTILTYGTGKPVWSAQRILIVIYTSISLIRSEIVTVDDLGSRKLGGPLHLQRLYSSSVQGRAAFFEYLKDSLQNYRRRVILLKVNSFMHDLWTVINRFVTGQTDDRFASGIFLRGNLNWDDDVS